MKLIINRRERTATFTDGEKEITMPYEDITIFDKEIYCSHFMVDIEVPVHQIETN